MSHIVASPQGPMQQEHWATSITENAIRRIFDVPNIENITPNIFMFGTPNKCYLEFSMYNTKKTLRRMLHCIVH